MKPLVFYLLKWLSELFSKKRITDIREFFALDDTAYSVSRNVIDIIIFGKTLYIYSERPGFIIGIHGKFIKELEENIKTYTKGRIEKIKLIQSSVSFCSIIEQQRLWI